MGSLIGGALGIGQQDASNPGIDFGGMSGILSKMDPLGNFITKMGGDPLNLYGNKNNPNALLFPGGQNQNPNAVPSVLPNLGQASMMPQQPMGAFMPPQMGQGLFQDMANISAGPQFNPAMQKGAQQPMQQTPQSTMMQQPNMQQLFGRFGNPGGPMFPRGFMQQ